MTTTNQSKVSTAAEQLISVTGDKTPQGLWDLADAIAGQADPGRRRVDRHIAARIRAEAIAAAGHEEFWSIGRLAELGNIAMRWPKADRVAGVTIDGHKEALSAADPKQWLADFTADWVKTHPKPPSIRDIRAGLGKNGVAQKNLPPRIDKASTEVFAEAMFARFRHNTELSGHLRKEVSRYKKDILKVGKMFADLTAVIEKIEQSPESAPTQSPKPATAPKPAAKKAETPKKKARINL